MILNFFSKIHHLVLNEIKKKFLKHFLKNKFSTLNKANPTNNQAPSQDSLQQRANNTRAMNRLTNCRLLQKNFDECIRQAQLDLEPSSRVRHNTLDISTPEAPKLTDLGNFIYVYIYLYL